ncbi:hypothetical protein BVC80_949g57 [Macleaya cordata]|uniref:Uncharacterized protein n=1 Tax=Macleaya cordata TaxID=56857 RepID=A0A200QX42_MACCD|nr:hypothetical protein BVC80_949g57 [Macleaya cordata]
MSMIATRTTMSSPNGEIMVPSSSEQHTVPITNGPEITTPYNLFGSAEDCEKLE